MLRIGGQELVVFLLYRFAPFFKHSRAFLTMSVKASRAEIATCRKSNRPPIGADITLPYAQQVLRNFIDSQARRITIESIQGLVELKAKNNARAIVYPRQIAMYMAKHLTEASPPEIGRQFGGKHHTTVLHSIKKIDRIQQIDKDLNILINGMTERLGG